MSGFRFYQGPEGDWTVYTALRGQALLTTPLLNKGTGFKPKERTKLGLHALLPDTVSSLDQQASRAYKNATRHAGALDTYAELADLQDRNEVVFFKVLCDNLEELVPIVYTPTVGEAIQRFSRSYRRPRGMWITPRDKGRVAERLRSIDRGEIRMVVVTDNESILGIGDQGAGGIAISIGKLALYTAAAGLHPATVLPISLDVGTDNEELLNDPLYVGYREPRLRGPEYDALVDEFVDAVKEVFPEALLHWEDFRKANAFATLARHQDRLPTFNDDIEGTAGVAVAAILAGCRAAGTDPRDTRVVIAGAGAAGIGIARLIQRSLRSVGIEGEKLETAICVLDSRGLVNHAVPPRDEYKLDFAWSKKLMKKHGLKPGATLEDVVAAVKPTVLIGTTGEPGAFHEDLVKTMAASCERPVILPFSNPTSKAEARPADVLKWTDGKALVATGSPFPHVQLGGKTFRIGQGNNVLVFPGIGLGTLAVHAKRITPGMFLASAHALANSVTDEDLAEGAIFPDVSRIREVTRAVAISVGKAAIREGVAEACDVREAVDRMMWEPSYPNVEAI